MTTSNILLLRKIQILENDIKIRKHRALQKCSPILYKEYKPCYHIIWKSIENDEKHVQLLKKKLI
jgi:hypothetical protein